MNRWIGSLVIGLLLLPSLAQADLWSGVLSADRGIDWSAVGATIPSVTTQCGATLASTSTAAQINAAITSCSGTPLKYVQLGTGTFTLTAGLTIGANALGGPVLRGDGADKTILKFTGNGVGCAATSAYICFVRGAGMNPGGTGSPSVTRNWTAGYSKGTTVVTLDSVSGLVVGQLMGLDQLDDAPGNVGDVPQLADDGDVWFCWSGFSANPVCSAETVVQVRANGRRNNIQIVQVTNIAGTDVTISPGVYMPTFNRHSGRIPQAWWGVTVYPGLNVGLEDVTVDVSGTNANDHVIHFSNVLNAWVSGVRIIRIAQNGERCYLCAVGAMKLTIKDSYFYGNVVNSTSGVYGTDLEATSSVLLQNNIWEGLSLPMTGGQALQGVVWGYNFNLNNPWTSTWMQGGIYNHAIGHAYHLYEGNDVLGFEADAIHGPSFFGTFLRNRLRGFDPDGGNPSGKTLQTIPANTYAFNRYFSFIGNVLGEPGYHTNYDGYPTSAGQTGNNPIQNISIYQSGWSDPQRKNVDRPVAPGIDNDLRVRATMFRWGNYDIVTGLPRWCGNASNTRWATAAPTGCASTSEVPTADSFHPNTIPATETIPNSFYLSAKPPWFGSLTWPPIGPDVTGGNLTSGTGGEASLDGHVYKIPARICYEAMATDTAYPAPVPGSTVGPVRSFNAAACLNATPPAVPTFGNLGIGTLTFNSTSSVPLWSKFTAPALNGRTISKLTAYLRDQSGGSFTLGGAVYAGNGTIPTTKLCEDAGNVTVTGTTPLWYEIPISCAFTTGQELWLALWGNTTNLVYNYESAGGNLNYKTGSTFETWPDPNAQSNLAPWALSIYATYNAIASELEPPTNMANLAAGTPTTTTIPLTWNAGSDSQGAITSSFELCAGTDCTNYVTVKTGVAGTSTTVPGLTPATLYNLRGWHVDTNSNSSVARSSVVTATTATEPTQVAPAIPTGLIISHSTTASVTLVWAPNTESDLAGYKVRSGPDAGQVSMLLATRTPASAAATHSSLTTYIARVPVGQVTYFSVTAYDTDGNESSGATVVYSAPSGITTRAARQ